MASFQRPVGPSFGGGSGLAGKNADVWASTATAYSSPSDIERPDGHMLFDTDEQLDGHLSNFIGNGTSTKVFYL